MKAGEKVLMRLSRVATPTHESEDRMEIQLVENGLVVRVSIPAAQFVDLLTNIQVEATVERWEEK